MRTSTSRGFTMVEMAVTILIIVVLSLMAYSAMQTARPRATLQSSSFELESLVHQARLQALSVSTDVAVLVFPTYVNGQGTGRFVVVQDEPVGSPNPSLFNSQAPLNFGNYNPATPQATPLGQVIDTVDLPLDVLVGPATGSGLAALPFPYNSITVNIDCSFCTAGGDRRGAIVFNDRGYATFYSSVESATGNTFQVSEALGQNGASLTLYGPNVANNATYTTFTLIITNQGMLRTYEND